MNEAKKHDFTLFHHVVTWLEKYIEQAHFFSDWEQRKQTDTSFIRWVKEDTPKSKILHSLGTSLMLAFEGVLDEEPLEIREEVKQEFYKWLDTSKIDTNAPKELKCALFDFHEILECRFEKAQKDRANRKREIEIDDPKYLDKLQEVFSKSQEAIHSGEINEVDNSRFNGDAEAGKATFETLANSLSAADKENFHFWPQMSEEEKAEAERKNKERKNRGEDPFLQAKRTQAINEITQAIEQEPKIPGNYLELADKNWEAKINASENIFEIQNIQNRVLADIKAKKQTFLQQEKEKKITRIFIISGISIMAILVLTIVLTFYHQKRNAKRK